MFFQKRKKKLEAINQKIGKLKTEGFNFELIKRYFNNKNNSKAFQVISNQTCEDLDFDLFFCFVDRTASKIGQQYLYNKLRLINYNANEALVQEALLEKIADDKQLRNSLQLELDKLNHSQTYYLVDLFQKKLEVKPKWYFLIPILSILTLTFIFLSFFYSSAILISLALFIINTFIHFGLKRKVNLFANSVPALLTLGSVAKKINGLEISTILDPNIKESIDVLSSIKRKMSFFKLEQKNDSDLEAIYWTLLEILKITFLLEPLILINSTEQIRNKTDHIENVFTHIGKIDTLLSIHSLRFGLDTFCYPKISNDNNTIHGKDIYHPLIADSIPSSLNKNKNTVLLSGSNMSGKTTFIRSLGLNYLSGINLNTCFASEINLPISKLFSIIRISDDISSSSSYFFTEINEMKKVINESTCKEGAIILLDELFKGTNTVERIAAAKSVLKFLSSKKNQVIATTHDLELTTLLKDNYSMYHFSENIKNGTIFFDYQLKEGVLKKGNAINILELNGYPESVIKEAKEYISDQFNLLNS